jgi:hypothetical protein
MEKIDDGIISEESRQEYKEIFVVLHRRLILLLKALI